MAQGDPVVRPAGDAGVPMLEGDPTEPIGPEDALGEGVKRGDYSDRQDGAQHFEAVDGELVDQNARVADVGDTEGTKGGVTSEPTPEGP